MKKYNRQRLILDLIERQEVKTQDELSDLLKEYGVEATQATISRDIKELRISKVQTANGEYKYTIIDTVHDSLNERLQKILRSAVLSVSSNESMVIVQTITHCAAVAGQTITNAKIEHVAGMVTGRDTIFIAVDHAVNIPYVEERIKEIMQ